MDLDGAIKILEHWEDDLEEWNKADTDGAVRLGIEALKAVKATRRRWGDRFAPTLPDED